MPTSRARAKNRPPKTWASTHEARSGPQKRHGSTSSSAHSRYRPHQWGKTPAQAAREAKQEELERGLAFYTHASPAGPACAAGSSFLVARSKSATHDLEPRSSEHLAALGEPRLKPPMLAYTADYDEANELLACLGPGPMGLDLEWNFTRFGGASRTALLQICSPSMILVIHMSAMSHRVPPLLKKILQDPTIIKTGVAIRNDALKLQRDYAIHTRNLLELSNLAKLAQPARWASVGTLISLRDLTRIYLGQRLRKGEVRVSDWERFPLEAEQIEYAASDTFASLEVLRAIAEHFDPTPPSKQTAPQGMLAQLDALEHAAQSKATRRETLDLQSALRLSAHDLFQERIELAAAERQKQQLRTALRELRAPVQPTEPSEPTESLETTKPAKPTEPTEPVATAARKRRTPSPAAKGRGVESSDDEVTVTRVMLAQERRVRAAGGVLAHDRAMQRWLYASETIEEVAVGASIKTTTVAQYLTRALAVAKRSAWQGDDSARELLRRFRRDETLRLDAELKAISTIERKRFRMLAKSLGWLHASDAAKQRASPTVSDDEDTSTSTRLGRAGSPIELVESDDAEDVVEPSH